MNEQLEQRVARAIIDAEESAEGQGAKFIPKALTEEHSGDCTKDPWTCARCYAEQYVGVAQAALKAHEEWLAEQGLEIVCTGRPNSRRPTVEELEKILEGPPGRVRITPAGEVVVEAHQQEE